MRGHWAIPVLASILILGSFALTQPASAIHFFENWVEAFWATIVLDAAPSPPTPDPLTHSTFSPFFLHSTPPTLSCSSSGECTITLPNIVDDLPNKFIEIDVEFAAPTALMISPPLVSGTDSFSGDEVTCSPSGPPLGEVEAEFLFVDIFCFPNPDFEIITLFFSPTDVARITSIFVGTESFGGFFTVGGTSIPIDTTSLLLAGASVNVWMIPVILSAAGFGILIARKI